MKHKILKRTGAALCALGLTLTALSSAYAKGEPSFWAENEVNSAIEKGYVPEDLQDLYTTDIDRKSTRLNSSHKHRSRMPSSA